MIDRTVAVLPQWSVKRRGMLGVFLFYSPVCFYFFLDQSRAPSEANTLEFLTGVTSSWRRR